MSTQSSNQSLSAPLRAAISIAALLNVLIGLAFLFGPELKLNLWPAPVSGELKRFIGAIILANGIVYITVDAIFLVPVAYIYWLHERSD